MKIPVTANDAMIALGDNLCVEMRGIVFRLNGRPERYCYGKWVPAAILPADFHQMYIVKDPSGERRYLLTYRTALAQGL